MSLRKRKKYDYPDVFTNYNETSDNNPSHLVDGDTNFSLRPITYMNIDEVVFTTFDKRFKISNKHIGLIQLDAEIASLPYQNVDQYDTDKGYLNLPYFTVWRSGVSPLYRSSPAHKPIIYSIPKMKAQGVVYEEYIMPAPKMEKLAYQFKFFTTFREHLNEFESNMNEYFKNKRNILFLDNERFEIMPSNQDERGALEVTEREGAQGQTLYIITYDCIVIAYTRNLDDVQKRERKNVFNIRIGESNGKTLDTGTFIATRLPKEGN